MDVVWAKNLTENHDVVQGDVRGARARGGVCERERDGAVRQRGECKRYCPVIRPFQLRDPGLQSETPIR